MAELWYWLTALLIVGYVVFDGFDLGAGALHRTLAHTDDERRTLFAAIGPYWDGNEVFLLAAGGTLFAAFTRALGAALSGMYLAVFLILWSLILRGLAIELRSHLRDPLWRAAWDTIFQASSAALALLFGVVLGNLLRGVHVDDEGWFSLELFSFESPSLARGIIDGYTLSVGVFSFLALAAHGARFIAWKTTGPLHDRAVSLATRAHTLVVPVWLGVIALSSRYAPAVMRGFAARPLAAVALAVAVAGLAVSLRAARRKRDRDAFIASCALLVGLLALVAIASFPVLVRSIDGVHSLTTNTARNADVSLAAGLRWWFVAAALVATYFVMLFHMHRGKVDLSQDPH
jgi:cytochrome d ubiquinol oxidase subunit II